MRVLITGACGFVGSHLAQYSRTLGDEVYGAVYSEAAGQRSYSTVALDISSRSSVEKVVREIAPDVVYHLAGLAFVPEAEESFSRTLNINVEGAYNILKCCADTNKEMVVVIVSSAEVYGKISAADLPLAESCELRPANNYSLSKLMSEFVARRFAYSKNLRPLVVRPFNHTGYGQNDRFVCSSFAKQLAQIKKGKSDPVLKVGNLDPKRDFSDVRDIVRGYRDLASYAKSATEYRNMLTVNLCSGKSHTIREILEAICEISGAKVTVETDPSRARPSEQPEIYGSYALAGQLIGWKPEYSLRETLEEVYRFWSERV